MNVWKPKLRELKLMGKKYIKKIHLYERLERFFCYFVHHLHQYEQQNSSAPSKNMSREPIKQLSTWHQTP